MFCVGMINSRSAEPVPTCALIWVQPPDKESTQVSVITTAHIYRVLIPQGGQNVRQGMKHSCGNKMSSVPTAQKTVNSFPIYYLSEGIWPLKKKKKEFVVMATVPWKRALGW